MSHPIGQPPIRRTNQSLFLVSRISILIIVVLYCLVGIEIFRRRRALRSIDSDTVPIENTLGPVNDASSGHSNNSVALTVEVSVESQPGNSAKSPVGKESVFASECSTRDMTL